MDAFTGCRILTGSSGLDNEIRWVNILEILDDLRYIEEGEFLITTAYDFDFRNTEKQELLIELFAGNKLAALAIQTGHYLAEIPASLIRLAEVHQIPLIEIPSDTSFKSLTRALMGELARQEVALHDEELFRQNGGLTGLCRQSRLLMQKLLAGENAEGLREQLRQLRISPYADYFLILVNADPVYKFDNVATAQFNTANNDMLEQSAVRLLSQYKRPFLLGFAEMNLVILIQAPGTTGVQAAGQVRNLIDEMALLHHRFEFIVGMSRTHSRLEEISQALAEAHRALEAAKLELTGEEHLIRYECLGPYRLLLEIENLSALQATVSDTLGPLLKYDRRTGGALVATLSSYLKHLNTSTAAEELFIHRHTLRYRLKQIEEMTGLSIDNTEHIFQFYLALKVYDYLKARKLNWP